MTDEPNIEVPINPLKTEEKAPVPIPVPPEIAPAGNSQPAGAPGPSKEQFDELRKAYDEATTKIINLKSEIRGLKLKYEPSTLREGPNYSRRKPKQNRKTGNNTLAFQKKLSNKLRVTRARKRQEAEEKAKLLAQVKAKAAENAAFKAERQRVAEAAKIIEKAKAKVDNDTS
jgi:hypothetical protein